MDASLGPILVVEDDRDHAVLIRSVFESRSRGTVMRIASTGREALDYLEGVPPYDDRAENPVPEVIILDLGLPGMNGFDVLSWLSVNKEYSDIPVVVFTASTDPKDARMAYSLGARSFKSKP
ncbi:MAG: response regulator, partial [Longimicrobiales bacterium]